MFRNLYMAVMLLFISSLSSQVLEVSKVFNNNSITPYNGQKLHVVYFWATWCGPCIPAGRQLEILQERFPNEMFMTAISEENNATISNFLERRPKRLYTVGDYNGSTFKKYGVQSLPYVIVFNQSGNEVWRGAPAGLTSDRIMNLHRRNSTIESRPLDWHVFEHVENVVIEDFTNRPLYVLDFDKEGASFFSSYSNQFVFKGSVSELLKAYYYLNDFELLVSEQDNRWVSLEINDLAAFKERYSLFDVLENELGFLFSKKIVSESVNELVFSNYDALIASAQKETNASYFVSEDRIEAFSAPISLIVKLLNDVSQPGVKYFYSGVNTNYYEWSLHYKYADLMRSELSDQFEIVLLENVLRDIEVYEVSLKGF